MMGGWGGEWEGCPRVRVYIYIFVKQKLTQICKAIILQFKKYKMNNVIPNELYTKQGAHQ